MFRQKWPKPFTPSLAKSGGTHASLKSAEQLATLKQGPRNNMRPAPATSQQASDTLYFIQEDG